MKAFFQYNWIVREEWYRWCEELPQEELLKNRTGGVGNILKTLFHIADVEWSWIQILQGKPDFQENFEEFKSLKAVRELDSKFRKDVEGFVQNWHDSMENNEIEDKNMDGTVEILTWGEVIRHVIAHEIHHIGQISVWSREIGKRPISANYVGRGIVPPKF